MSRIKIDDIRKELELKGWKVLSPEYKNLNESMRFQCDNGHEIYTTWKKLRNNLECPVCSEITFKKDVPRIVNNEDFTPTTKKKGTKRILAFDQATHVSGWAVFDNNVLIKSGIFIADDEEEMVRDTQIKNWVISLVKMWTPDVVGLEDIQLQKNEDDVKVVTYKVVTYSGSFTGNFNADFT